MSERGELTSVAAADWFSAISGGAAVQGSEKKIEAEKDLVTVRFEEIHPSRLAVEGLGRSLQLLVSACVFCQFKDYVTSGWMKFLYFVSRLFMIELKMASLEESFAFAELAANVIHETSRTLHRNVGQRE